MNRLQKKCFIAAMGLHLLLVLILLIGPAFISSNSKTEDVPVIVIIPDKTTDENISGGGQKGGTPPAAQPAPPIPAPQPPAPTIDKTPRPPEPVQREKTKEITPPDEPKDIVKPSNSKIVVSTKPVIRKPDPQAAARERAAAEARATAERQRIASALNHATTSIAGGVSKATDIKINPGNGDGSGGPSYGNWASAVKLVYMSAWIVPDDVTTESAIVSAKVTVARDGTVISANIARLSGNGVVDQSVKATLDRVRRLPPLPDSSTEDQRTVTIAFDLKAKQGLG